MSGVAREVVERIASERTRFLHFLHGRTGSYDEAEEVLQAALARSLESAHALRDHERVVPWFYRLLRNALVDRARSRAAEARAMERLGGLASEAAPSEADELRELVCGCVTRLLDTMPEAAGTLLRRVELGDESIADVARAEGSTANAVGVRLFRARKALRARLQACCGECGDPTCHDCDRAAS